MVIFPSLQSFIFFGLSVLILKMFVRIKWFSFHFNNKKVLPPSPRRLPIIGNFHQLGSSPNRSLQVLSQKYGPIMLLHFGSIPTLVASSAEVAEEILKTHDLTFSSRPSLTIPNMLFYGSKDIAFSPYGEYWRQSKSLVVLNLLSNTRVKSFKKVREKEISLMLGVLRESCGSLVDMDALFSSLTNNIICRVAFGRIYDGIELTNLLKDFVKMFTVFSVGTYIPWLSWVDRLTGLEGKAKKVAKEFDEFLKEVIEEHVNKNKWTKAESDENQDLVDILLDIQRNNTTEFEFDNDTIKAIILDIFTAGNDTTLTSLQWTITELVKNPRAMKKLQQEVTLIGQGRSVIVEEDLEKMEYLKAVIKESLRMHAPLPLLVPRLSTQDVKVMGYDIPSHTQVIINAWAIGRDPAKWDDPDEFKPERFLNNSIEYKGLHFEWLPFGGGRRGCPGIQFGVAVIELALANILYKFNLALPNGVKNEDLDMSETCGITLRKTSPLMVIASPRF